MTVSLELQSSHPDLDERPSMKPPPFHILMPVFDPNVEYLTEQIASIARQSVKAERIVFVVSDLESEDIISAIADKYRLVYVILIPREKLNSVSAFEFGLRYIIDEGKNSGSFYIALSDQDDIWEEQKLYLLQSALRSSGVGLVYSDAAVVDAENRLISGSVFKLENRVRRPGIRELLYANSITGMTCAFTYEVAAASLPFPRQNGLLFHHDLWLGLVASTLGGVAFIDEPLVRYRQHGNNAVGAVMRKREKRRAWRDFLRQKVNSFYLANYLAKMLYYRAEQMHAANLQVNRRELGRLKPHLIPFGIGFSFIGDAARLLILGKPRQARTALSFSLVRLLRLVWATLQVWNKDFFARVAEFDRRRFDVIPGVQPTSIGDVNHTPNASHESKYLETRKWGEYIDARKSAKWRPDFSANIEPAICILVPTLNPTEMFAGVATALDFGIGLAELGHNIRFIAGDLPIISETASINFIQSRIKGVEQIQRIKIYCGVTSPTIPSHKQDIFFATAWWSAHIASTMINAYNYNRKHFIYLIQDYEPNFYPWGDDFAGAMLSYDFDYIPVFNTTLLRDYFFKRSNREGGRRGIAFHPSIELATYSGLTRLGRSGPRRLAVYGRPEVARNMFAASVESLSHFIIEHQLDYRNIECVSIGMSHPTIELPNGLELRSVGKIPWDKYPAFLSEIDLGIALMYSPHPSHLPLEMAAAGVRIVTNRFANKDLSRLSQLIYSADPHPRAISAALANAWLDLGKGPPKRRDRNLDLRKLGKPMRAAIRELSARIARDVPPASPHT